MCRSALAGKHAAMTSKQRTIAGRKHRQDEDVERAEELAEETAEQNADEETTREAIEQELASEDLSEEGEWIGEHNE
jgi:hypothetical protein